jgi:hypothetical protein
MVHNTIYAHVIISGKEGPSKGNLPQDNIPSTLEKLTVWQMLENITKRVYLNPTTQADFRSDVMHRRG